MLTILLLAALQDPGRQFKLQGVATGDYTVATSAAYAALFHKERAEAAMKANPVDFSKERLAVVARTGSDGGWEVTFDVPRRTDTEIVVGYWFWRTPRAAVQVATPVAAGLVLERSDLPLRFEKRTGEPPPKK